MSENMKHWDALRRPPEDALKKIGGGRLKGMTDISPQWRMEAMTEHFGPVGFGWRYEIVRTWIDAANEETVASVEVALYVKDGGEWSAAIPGIGGSMLVAREKSGLYVSDEAYKMALTDALSVAFKSLGLAADIYRGRWDGSKYLDPPEPVAQKSVDDWVNEILDAETMPKLKAVFMSAIKSVASDDAKARVTLAKDERKEQLTDPA